MIDSEGFRANVGIILSNADHQVFWARRTGMEAWQFPQGGIRRDETPEMAMYRELSEEIGLNTHHVSIIGSTQEWLRYWLPKQFIRFNKRPVCIGQKQIWYLLRFVGDPNDVRLDASEAPEFEDWQWVNYWTPMTEVVEFKREVYQKALTELAPLVLPERELRSQSDIHG